MSQSLTFDQLRKANTDRLPMFNVCVNWTLSDWVCALTGELGEAANIIKKVNRGDVSLRLVRDDLGKELADIQTYLDILAMKIGVDLGEATIAKWNEVSERVGSDLRLGDKS